MIAAIRGTLQRKESDAVVINIGAVDLTVFVPATLLSNDIAVGDHINLVTYLHVRESDLSLFGFESSEQKNLFILLLGVNGIGPRSAMSLLSIFSTDVLTTAIVEGKAEALSRAPGIGRKTAQRIVLQLQDKLDLTGVGEGSYLTEADEDVIAALTSLGYSLVEAQRMVQLLPRDIVDVEERLRLALERLGEANK
jgi:holliday junction DNA helicase RuvA